MDLNNRELAFLVWAALGAIWAAQSDQRRAAFGGVLRALCNKKLIAALGLAAVWIGTCVWALTWVGWWTLSNLKTTLLWSITFAVVTMFDVARISKDSTFFGKTLRDMVNATALVTFIAELYTFSFLVELASLPFLVMATAMHVHSERDAKHARVHKLFSAILVTAGLAYVLNGAYAAATHFKEFATLDNAREFLLPILLSLLFLPFIYSFSVLVSYEENLARLHVAFKDAALRRYAARQAVLRLRFDLDAVRRWTRNVVLFRQVSQEEIDKSITEVQLLRRRERNPPLVHSADGWSPYAAARFAGAELSTGDYHRVDDQWFASSPMRSLDQDALVPDYLAYYIEGDERAAKRLKLELDVNGRCDPAVSERRFMTACASLLQAALGSTAMLAEQATGDASYDSTVQERRIQMVKKSFSGHAFNGYSRTLIVDFSPQYGDPFEVGH